MYQWQPDDLISGSQKLSADDAGRPPAVDLNRSEKRVTFQIVAFHRRGGNTMFRLQAICVLCVACSVGSWLPGGHSTPGWQSLPKEALASVMGSSFPILQSCAAGTTIDCVTPTATFSCYTISHPLKPGKFTCRSVLLTGDPSGCQAGDWQQCGWCKKCTDCWQDGDAKCGYKVTRKCQAASTGCVPKRGGGFEVVDVAIAGTYPCKRSCTP